MNRLVPLAAVAAVTWVGLTACSSSTEPPSSFCVPRITVEPDTVRPGDTIVMESDTFCDVEPPMDGWSVAAFPEGEPALGVRIPTVETFDGSFRLAIVIPDTFPVGDAYVQVENWDYSACDDTGSCASAGAGFTVKP